MQETNIINGRYVTSELLGGGGMAQVFLARDEVLERDVAVKVLREQYAEDGEFVERFRREALGVASLSHPNIVQVYDRGVSEDGRYYIAMEYVAGGTLKDRIDRNGPLSPATATAVAVQIADALGAAHERGLIHRDVKPQNVLVTASGDVKVADFGIARAAAADVISRTSAVLGTARYMSPEQAMGLEVGPPGDLYSLGVVLYEMLTGVVPFEADTPVAISMKHVNEQPRPPREVRGGIPEGLNAVVLKLLAKDPGNRYAGAAALVADLDRAADGRAPVGGTDNEAQTARLRPALVRAEEDTGPRRRRRKLLPVLLALAALMGAVTWGILAGPNVGEIVGSLEGVPDRAREEAGEWRETVDPPSEVTVPGVESLDEAAARERLTEAGLGTVTRERRSDEEKAGQVLEQSVPPGKKVEEDSRVLLAISSGPGPGGQRGSAPDPAPGDRPEGPERAEGPGDPPNPENDGGSDPAPVAASAEPAPVATPEAEQGANEASSASPEPRVPAAPSSPEPSSREAPAVAPSSPEPSSREAPVPVPSSPEAASPEPASPTPSSPESSAPSSPEPASPGPSSPEPASPGPSSPDPSSPGPASPGPASPGPSEPGDSSAEPASPGPSSVGADPAESPSPEDD